MSLQPIWDTFHGYYNGRWFPLEFLNLTSCRSVPKSHNRGVHIGKWIVRKPGDFCSWKKLTSFLKQSRIGCETHHVESCCFFFGGGGLAGLGRIFDVPVPFCCVKTSFCARLQNLPLWLEEECVVTDVSTHPVEQATCLAYWKNPWSLAVQISWWIENPMVDTLNKTNISTLGKRKNIFQHDLERGCVSFREGRWKTSCCLWW